MTDEPSEDDLSWTTDVVEIVVSDEEFAEIERLLDVREPPRKRLRDASLQVIKIVRDGSSLRCHE